jgi:hypothetical protein
MHSAALYCSSALTPCPRIYINDSYISTLLAEEVLKIDFIEVKIKYSRIGHTYFCIVH